MIQVLEENAGNKIDEILMKYVSRVRTERERRHKPLDDDCVYLVCTGEQFNLRKNSSIMYAGIQQYYAYVLPRFLVRDVPSNV